MLASYSIPPQPHAEKSRHANLSNSLFYNSSIEIFIALRDVDYTYYLDDTKRVVPCLKKVDRYVTVYTQPPGALRDVAKCKTEVLYRNKNPAFVTKVNLDFDMQDLGALFLNCKVSYWDEMKVPVLRIVQAGPKGLDIPLKLKFEYNQTDVHNKYTDFACSEVVPGRLFLRAEILQPIDKGIVLQFGLMKSGVPSAKNRYLEFSKLNEGNLFDPATAFPYTLMNRTEPGGSSKEANWIPCYYAVNSICNGDLNRVLKIEIHKADCKGTRPHFVLTTLGQILEAENKILKIPITRSLDGSVNKKHELMMKISKEVSLHTFDYYLSKGLAIRRLYAVNYASSNWHMGLHKVNLQNRAGVAVEGTSTVYEVALQVFAESTNHFTEMSGDSVFYSFGNTKMEQYVSPFPYHTHLESLIAHYREALLTCKKAEMAQYSSMPSLPSSFNQTRRASSSRSPFACFTAICNPLLAGTHLAPLLRDILSLLSIQNNGNYYNTVYIFTDGQISDIHESTEMINTLSKLPVSLIIVGMGSGDFAALQELEYAWLSRANGQYSLRNIVHLIHFRSWTEWNSAIKFAKFVSSPFEILKKEIFTAIRDHCLTYMRLYRSNF